MLHRVIDPNKNYKKRGIKVCEEWQSFDAFLKWAVESGFRPELQIDRIDNDGNYEPENCRWVTHAEQQQNTSRTRWIKAWGETKCLSEWGRDDRCMVTRWGIAYRLRRGWTPEKAISG